MLADPRLVVAPGIEFFDQLEVALERQRRVLADGVEGRHEYPELHPAGLGHLLTSFRANG